MVEPATQALLLVLKSTASMVASGLAFRHNVLFFSFSRTRQNPSTGSWSDALTTELVGASHRWYPTHVSSGQRRKVRGGIKGTRAICLNPGFFPSPAGHGTGQCPCLYSILSWLTLEQE